MNCEKSEGKAKQWLRCVIGKLGRMLRRFSDEHGWRPVARLRRGTAVESWEVGSSSVIKASLVVPEREGDVTVPAWVTETVLKQGEAVIERSIRKSEVERLGRGVEYGVETAALVLDDASGEVSVLVARKNS